MPSTLTYISRPLPRPLMSATFPLPWVLNFSQKFRFEYKCSLPCENPCKNPLSSLQSLFGNMSTSDWQHLLYPPGLPHQARKLAWRQGSCPFLIPMTQPLGAQTLLVVVEWKNTKFTAISFPLLKRNLFKRSLICLAIFFPSLRWVLWERHSARTIMHLTVCTFSANPIRCVIIHFSQPRKLKLCQFMSSDKCEQARI